MEAAAGVPQDYEEAVRWYLRAAEQGDVEAQNALGFRYRTGRGVPQDDDEHTDERLVHDSTPSPVGHRRVGDGA